MIESLLGFKLRKHLLFSKDFYDSSPLHSHLELARFYWKMVLQAGDWAIDATCGNGKDTLQLGKFSLGGIIGLDKQQIAIENTTTLIKII